MSAFSRDTDVTLTFYYSKSKQNRFFGFKNYLTQFLEHGFLFSFAYSFRDMLQNVNFVTCNYRLVFFPD